MLFIDLTVLDALALKEEPFQKEYYIEFLQVFTKKMNWMTLL